MSKRPLIIAEKPSVAKSLANAVGAYQEKNGYLEGRDCVVSWCLGHLAEYVFPESYDEKYANWRFEDLPIIPDPWRLSVSRDKKQQYTVLKELMARSDIDFVINACDAGREGELIFRRVYDLAKCKLPVMRLWISSMEDEAIRAGFRSMKPGEDYDSLAAASVCRAKADWLIGINESRAFTATYGRKLILGRVQTPTLAMIVEREAAIKDFQKEQFFLVHLKKDGLDAVSDKFKGRAEADALAAACSGKDATAMFVDKEQKQVAPPRLYDLTSLQRDANKLFGLTASQTLEAAQALYESKLITYPRTDRQVDEYGWKGYEEVMKAYLRADTPEEEEKGIDTQMPELHEGDVITAVDTEVNECWTKPPQHFTEASLLSTMEHAGAKEMDDDVERKGLGTPATRASMIEKLISGGYVTRKKKQLLPTDEGKLLISLVPDYLKSASMTAEWENRLLAMERGEDDPKQFMEDIVAQLMYTLEECRTVPEDVRRQYSTRTEEAPEPVGVCPICGKPVYEGRKLFYCSDTDCNFCLWKSNRFLEGMNKKLTRDMAVDLLADGRTYVKGLYSKKRDKTFTADLVLEISEGRPKFVLEFPKGREKR